jgi:hypothetical protein
MEPVGFGPAGQPRGGYSVQLAGGGGRAAGGRSLRGGRSLHGKRYRLTIGSMGLTVFDGAKPKDSYLYANMCRWEAGPGGFSIDVGTAGQRVEFVCEGQEGHAIVAEITAHAREIADRYLAVQAEQEQQRQQKEEEREAREAAKRQAQQRAAQDGISSPSSSSSLSAAPFTPRDGGKDGGSGGAAIATSERAFSQDVAGVSASHQHPSAEHHPPCGILGGEVSPPSDEVLMKQAKALELAEQAVERMQHADRPDDYRPAQTLCEAALQLDPSCALARGTLDHVTHAMSSSQGAETTKFRQVSKLGKKVWAAGGAAVSATGHIAAAGHKVAVAAKNAPASTFSHRARSWLSAATTQDLVSSSSASGSGGGIHHGGTHRGQSVSIVGIAKVYVDGAQRLEPSKRFTVCAFLGSSAARE